MSRTTVSRSRDVPNIMLPTDDMAMYSSEVAQAAAADKPKPQPPAKTEQFDRQYEETVAP